MIRIRFRRLARRPRIRCRSLFCGAASLLLATVVAAGPLHDPWLERFQVGAWGDPDAVDVVAGFPAGLLEPARLDTVWTTAAAAVLGTTGPEAADLVSRRFLSHLHPAGADSTWRRRALSALLDLESGRPGNQSFDFVRRERLVAGFGAAMERGDPAAAADLAEAVLVDPSRPPLPARERLTWRLRALAAGRLAGQTTGDATTELWPEFADLGSFDTGNAWALWVAMRRAAVRPVLSPDGDQEALGTVLGRLGTAWLTAAELYASSLPADWQAGLGGVLLPAADLAAHFDRFPTPPDDFTRQGWWVRGQRRLHKGAAAAYENLAARDDLKPGWQLDVWRRASERRLLAGAWVEGLADLEQALTLAGHGHGTRGLRLRLRQWTEQALVLALAAEDLASARRIRQLGQTAFAGEEGAAFARETAQWADRLDHPGSDPGPAGDDLVDVVRHRITRGLAPDVVPVSDAARDSFVGRADTDLWELWTVWGLTLADPEPVQGERRARAIRYGNILAGGAASGALADSALAAVALRLGDRDWLPVLLRQAVDTDTVREGGWRTPPWPSPVPDLLPDVRGSELDRHALLGFFLAVGDMRGVLGVAYELPGRGLTRAQKRLFLYPLPAPGPIREAILAADSEPALLLAVARNESLFEPAVRSRAGALGWMQIMPFHYPQRGAVFGAGNWRIPAQSIGRGDGLLVENRRRYAGDPYRVLAAYNAGPGAAGRWDRQLGGDAARDIYLAWIGYPETRSYVEKVLIDREIYSAIIGANYGLTEPVGTIEE